MSEFDPYYLWLGIPPEEQPPHHYRLLAITLFENEAEVIEAAADRQMSYVKTHATGQHSDLSQKLLNEISKARICLLRPEKKAEYDRELKAQLAAEETKPQPRQKRKKLSAQAPSQSSSTPSRTTPAPGLPQVQPQQTPSGPVAPDTGGSKLRRKKPLWQQPAVIAGAFGGLIALVLIIYLFGQNRQVDVVDDPVPTDRKTRVETLPKKKTLPEKTESPIPKKKKDAPPKGKIPTSTPNAFAGSRAGQEREGNALEMKFCWCPPGKFTMGSPKTEPDRNEDEDQVDVTFTRGFWLGKFELTQAQWEAVMGTQPWTGNKKVKVGDDYPATFMSWDDAMKFCAKLTNKEHASGKLPTGWEYRLPTEAQWEYACRAGSKTRFSFGDDVSRLGDYAWFIKSASGVGENYAHRVGTKRSNAWGLHDMHGNVLERCSDWYQKELPGGTEPKVTTGKSVRVVRDGSWVHQAVTCSCAHRHAVPPNLGIYHVGFRVAVVQTAPLATRSPADGESQ